MVIVGECFAEYYKVESDPHKLKRVCILLLLIFKMLQKKTYRQKIFKHKIPGCVINFSGTFHFAQIFTILLTD